MYEEIEKPTENKNCIVTNLVIQKKDFQKKHFGLTEYQYANTEQKERQLVTNNRPELSLVIQQKSVMQLQVNMEEAKLIYAYLNKKYPEVSDWARFSYFQNLINDPEMTYEKAIYLIDNLKIIGADQDDGEEDQADEPENYDDIVYAIPPDNGNEGIIAINLIPDVVYTSFQKMYQAINTKEKKQSYKGPRESCEKALETLHKTTPDPSQVMLAKASEITNSYLKSNLRALHYRDKSPGLANKRNYEEAEIELMNSLAAAFQKLAQTFIEKPKTTYRKPGDVLTEKDQFGREHKLGTSYEIVTGRVGGAEGTDAFGMTASGYLSEQYGLKEKNQMIAGHIVTRKAGGKAEDDNLSPFPSYDFNQTLIRTPESTAESLLRKDRVIRYSSRLIYNRNSNDGSSVNFNAQDLKLIGSSVQIRIDELKLAEGGDGKNLEHWMYDKTHYNNTLPISLRNVVSGDNTDREDYED